MVVPPFSWVKAMNTGFVNPVNDRLWKESLHGRWCIEEARG